MKEENAKKRNNEEMKKYQSMCETKKEGISEMKWKRNEMKKKKTESRKRKPASNNIIYFSVKAGSCTATKWKKATIHYLWNTANENIQYRKL